MTNYRDTKGSFAVLCDFVPEGLNEGCQAVYCLECADNQVRPVGYGVVVSSRLARYLDDTVTCANHTVPAGRVALLRLFQAINCLATIIASLRDNPRIASDQLNVLHSPALANSLTLYA
jgi:hypothetical protein